MSTSDKKGDDPKSELSLPSILTKRDLAEMGERYNFPDGMRVKVGGRSADRVIPGYVCAYQVFFEECGLRFPIPRLLIQFCDRLGLQFAQMCPNFVRQVMALLLLSKEAGVSLDVNDLGRLLVAKRNSKHHPVCFYLANRPRQGIVTDLPGKDKNWGSKYFYYEICERMVEVVKDCLSVPWKTDCGN